MVDSIDTTDLERAMVELDREMVAGVQRATKLAVLAGRTTAIATSRFKDRTGNARRSIIVSYDETPRGAKGEVVCAVPYASYLDKGTRPHEIRARNASALRWEDVGGGVHFATVVQHPGTKPDGFMGRAAAEAERVLVAEVERTVAQAARRLGG